MQLSMFDQDLLGANEFMGLIVIPVDEMLNVHPTTEQKVPNHAPMWCAIPTRRIARTRLQGGIVFRLTSIGGVWPRSFKRNLTKDPIPDDDDMDSLRKWKPSDAGKHGSLQFEMKLSSFERVGRLKGQTEARRTSNVLEGRVEGTLVVQLVSMHDLPVRATNPPVAPVRSVAQGERRLQCGRLW